MKLQRLLCFAIWLFLFLFLYLWVLKCLVLSLFFFSRYNAELFCCCWLCWNYASWNSDISKVDIWNLRCLNMFVCLCLLVLACLRVLACSRVLACLLVLACLRVLACSLVLACSRVLACSSDMTSTRRLGPSDPF